MRVLALSSLRDEGLNILHWIAHHRAAGVTDWLLFTNDCADGTDTLLDLLQNAGIVTHVRNAVPEGRTPQWAALRQARDQPSYARADWAMVIDCDEYVNLRPSVATIPDLIGRADADAIVLPWRLFGHNGHARRPDTPPTEAYTRAISTDALYPALSRFFKTLYRRDAFRAPGVHRPKPMKDSAPKWVDGSGHPLDDSFAQGGQIMLWGQALATDLVQLNHYSVRSAEDFIAKVARGLPNHTDKPVDLTYWVERNFNTVADDTVAPMAPATTRELAFLREIPGVAEAEEASRNWHRSRFDAALRDPALVKLFGRLLLAAGSAPPDRQTAMTLVRLFQRAGV